MPSVDALSVYREQACSRQWRGFLQALATEFEEALPAPELERLMSRVGERFAQVHPLPEVVSLEQLQQACNRVWSGLDWGEVVFEEGEMAVDIVHAGAPLGPAFGRLAGWPQGFLLGAYRHWLRAAGMLPGLDVRPADGGTEDVVHYRLARVA